jgi:hypothetical protein
MGYPINTRDFLFTENTYCVYNWVYVFTTLFNFYIRATPLLFIPLLFIYEDYSANAPIILVGLCGPMPHDL